MGNELHAAASKLAALGHPVLPLHSVVRMANGRFVCTCGKLGCRSPGKHPHGGLVRNGSINATADSLLIDHWWTAVEYANIGVATGELVVLDVDPRHDGDHTLRVLEDKHGPLPPTWRSITGSGGEHVFFTTPVGIPNSEGKVGEGLDIRGTGGLIVAPPSLHVSGREYAWNVDAHPDDVPLASIPQWLLSLATARAGNGAATDWGKFAVSKIAEGCRNSSLAQLSGLLLRRYVDAALTAQLVLSWNQTCCQPPLESDEVLTIVRSIANRELRRREAGMANG
jgi:hypothetical protein